MQLWAREKAITASAKTVRLLPLFAVCFALGTSVASQAHATLGYILCNDVMVILWEILKAVTVLSIAAIGGAAIMGKVDTKQAVIVCVGAGIALIGFNGGYFLDVLPTLTGGALTGC